MRRLIQALIPFVLLAASAVLCFAQGSDFNLSMHANSHATAKDIGLPVYPGATPFQEKDSDSSADLGFELNSVHFSLQAAHYVTPDPRDQVIRFYRKALAKYGDVLECDHGKPVGSLTETNTGLTCGDHGSDDGYELRAGKPEQFRIVAIDSSESQTKFGMVSLALPKEETGK